MFRIFGQLRDIAGKLQELRVRSIETETSAKVAFRNASEALSRAVKCEDAAVERGNELISRWQASESQWWKRWEDVVHALQKHSQDMAELDKRITTLEGRQYMAEADAKPLIEIVEEPKAKRSRVKTRQSASVRRRWYIGLCNADEAVKAVWEQAQLKGVSMDAAALYEATGGFRCHKGRMESSIVRHAAAPLRYVVAMIDRTRGKSANGNDQMRSFTCETLARRENMIQNELPAYHALWASRAYYSEKGRKP